MKTTKRKKIVARAKNHLRQTLGYRLLIDLAAFYGVEQTNYEVDQIIPMGDRLILVRGKVAFSDVTHGKTDRDRTVTTRGDTK